MIFEDALGQWKENKMNGKGMNCFTNGDKYTGDWVDSKRTGQGVFTWCNGTRYEGVHSITIAFEFIISIRYYEIPMAKYVTLS